jgi:diguanylate cyclase (GGDEF)-like protein/PAS domain S-box-containing protein
MAPRALAALMPAISAELAQLGLTSWRRIALVAVPLAYGVLYVLWYLFRWGGPGLELGIADAATVPIGLFATVAAFSVSRRASSGGSRRAWAAIALGFSAYAFGDIAWFWIEVVQATDVPFPSVADIGYLAFFPLMLLGLALLPREQPERRLRSALDMAIVIVGATTAVWWLVLGPVVAASGGEPSEVLIALAYPVFDSLVLFGILVALLARLTETPRTVLALLAIGLGLNVAADLTYARLALQQDYVSGTWLDLGYVLGWVVTGIAAVLQGHVSVRHTASTASAPLRPITFLPYVAIAAVYVLLALSTFGGGNGDRVLVGGAIVVTALVVGRQIHTARENATLMTVQASAREAARFQVLIKNASDVILVTDPAGRITFATPSAEPLFKREPTALEGASITALLDPAEAPMVMALLGAAAERPGISAPSVFQVAGADARWVEMRVSNLLDDPLVSGLVATIHDITERRAFEQQLEAQALHDPLTGLANRVLFADRVEQAIVRARRSRRLPAVLYLDLDDFKRINDTLGHAAGDQVLVEVARRIRDAVRGEDTAGRLGGDEFAVLIDETRDVNEAVTLANRLAAAFAPPFEAGGSQLPIACSIGIVRSDQGGASSGELLRNADIAMYAAKREARGSHQVFQQAMYAETVGRVRMEADLRQALDRGEFRLVYQPLMGLIHGGVSGVEALLRWHHPERGLVMPTDFIPLAERSGEIRRIGKWVLEEACRTVGSWNAALGDRPVKANVNVSVVQLEPGFVDEVAAILAETKFPAERLVVEITESVFSDERSDVVEVLSGLRRLGVRISIDDFGTGYSSLSRLRELPVDELKIDRAFVNQLGAGDDGSLVSTILHLAQELSLNTVAEGIEENVQMQRLRELGCDVGQGFLLGRPTEAANIEDLLSGSHAEGRALPRSA